MSLHFVIDGYNLIRQVPALNNEDCRGALIRFLAAYPLFKKNNKFSIVFDGKEGMCRSQKFGNIEVVFSQKPQSADDIIKGIIRQSGLPGNIIVVTNDREIRDYAKTHSANINTIEEFMAKTKPRQVKDADGKMPLPPHEASKINDELSKKWLA